MTIDKEKLEKALKELKNYPTRTNKTGYASTKEWRQAHFSVPKDSFEIIEEAATAYLQSQNQWEPIETAPKDGTEIILGKDIATVWIVRNGRWVNPDAWVPPDEEDVGGWWCYRNSVVQEILEGIFEPTHWMPLPNPPKGI